MVVLITVALSVTGLLVFRRFVSQRRLARSNAVLGYIFTLAGVLYAVLVAFVVIVVWEQFDAAKSATEAEAAAIADLLRDSDALPVGVRPMIQDNLLSYTRDVVDNEFPRMRTGARVEQQSERLTAIWEGYFAVHPVSPSEVAFYNEAIKRLDDLGANRKIRISTSLSDVPDELWMLLLGGGAVVLGFTYLFGTADTAVHGAAIGLCGALVAFVLYLIFALEHPFIGSLAVRPDAYVHLLTAWTAS